jgi:vacuolar protein sorting-associated protein 3
MSAQKGTGSRKRRLAAPETGPFVLRSLLEDVPLSAEGEKDDIEINCVEFLG